jgi:arsenical pump membrane protein
VWLLLPAAGLLSVVTGLLPVPEATGVVERVLPVLVFLVGITVVAEIASAAGVFDAAARETARWARGRTWLLWLLTVALAVACTVVLSLDTTAVLLTPVVLAVGRRTGVSTALLALTTVWLANTASLLLPVSNLTNLLAAHLLPGGAAAFAALSWRPALAAVLATVALLAVVFARRLRGRFVVPPAPRPDDPPLFWTCAGTCLALGPAFLSGVPVWTTATAAATLLVVVSARRRRLPPAPRLVPYRLVATAVGLFLVVQALQLHGLPALTSALAGSGESAADLLRVAGAGALAANAVNNLPAYLALEPVAGSAHRLMALLVGVDAGPLVTPWASLATLLWHERCRAAGVDVPWLRFVALGLVAAPVVVAAAVLALAP